VVRLAVRLRTESTQFYSGGKTYAMYSDRVKKLTKRDKDRQQTNTQNNSKRLETGTYQYPVLKVRERRVRRTVEEFQDKKQL
jgi:hypothetical protein